MRLRRLALWSDAEAEFRTALSLWEKLHGPDHPDVSLALSNLASVLAVQEKQEEAEAVFRDALARRERSKGRARALAQRAMSDYEAAGELGTESLEAVGDWLQRSAALRPPSP